MEGPPQGGLEIRVTGNNYDDIASATEELVAELGTIDGVVNVSSDISEARDEIVIDVDPGKAGAVGLSAQTVAFQVSQFLVGRSVAEVEIDGDKIDVVLTGPVRRHYRRRQRTRDDDSRPHGRGAIGRPCRGHDPEGARIGEPD